MFEKMLVCLDGSQLAELILPYAEAQSRCFGTRVTLIQVVVIKNPEVIAGGAAYREIQELAEHLERLVTEAESYLNNVAETLKGKAIEANAVVIKASSAGAAIVKYAEENNLNLIAIASHGRSGLREILFGSVAEYVYKNSGLPILMIKPKRS